MQLGLSRNGQNRLVQLDAHHLASHSMGKKKAAGPSGHTSAAKAAKKVKTLQKVERKEEKKTKKSKGKATVDEPDDDQDLDAILDKVGPCRQRYILRPCQNLSLMLVVAVDAARVGGVACSCRGARRGPAQSKSQCDPHCLSHRESSLVYRWRVFRR